jgi:hypothetical protein
MVALTRKRNRKTLKRRRTRRVKKHTTRRFKQRLLRTRVKKNKTRKLQRGGLKDGDALSKDIDEIIKKNPEYKDFIETKIIKIDDKGKIKIINKESVEIRPNKFNKKKPYYYINYEAIKNTELFKEFNAIMTNKIINNNFKKCLNDCPDDNALATMLLKEEESYGKSRGWFNSSYPYFDDKQFLTLDIELDKIKEARIIFDEIYNKSEDDLVRKKKFITVLLNSALHVVAVDVRSVKDQPSAITCFTNAFKITLDDLIQNDLEFKSDNKPANKTKTTRPSSDIQAMVAHHLQKLSEVVNPYENTENTENPEELVTSTNEEFFKPKAPPSEEDEFGFDDRNNFYDLATPGSNPSSNRD